MAQEQIIIRVDAKPIVDAIIDLQKTKKIIEVEKLPANKPIWLDYTVDIFTILMAIATIVNLSWISWIRNIIYRENLTGTYKIKKIQKVGKEWVLYIDLFIKNNGYGFVELEFTKNGKYSIKNRNYRPNNICNPIFINNHRVLRRFIYMNNSKKYHKNIWIPPKAENFYITIEAGDGNKIEKKDVKFIKMVTKKGKLFTFNESTTNKQILTRLLGVFDYLIKPVTRMFARFDSSFTSPLRGRR